MREQKNEFLGLLCNMYIVFLLAVLPLYTGDGYGQLGITKYVLFRNVSLLCLGCWLLLGMPERIRTFVRKAREIAGRSRQVPTRRRADIAGRRQAKDERGIAGQWRAVLGGFSLVDCAVAAYGLCVVLSTLCSHYKLLAWLGYEEWYMGALSQLMFVGIYFFASRQYDGSIWPLYMGEAAFFLVSAFGLLHKLGIDPLGLQRGWNSGDWVYSHMLSTLGNINWLCGFYSVALAFVMAHYLQEERVCFLVPLYAASVSAFVLLGIQGSQGGLLIIGVCVAVCLLSGWRQRGVPVKIFLLLAGFFMGMPLMKLLMDLRGKEAAVVRDGDVFDKTVWYEWVAAALICTAVCAFLHKRGENACREKKGSKKSRVPVKALILVSVGLCVVFGFWVFARSFDDSFGSGRGFLWRIAVESFAQADFKEKFVGSGPDCFGAAVFARLGAGTDVWKGDHWDGSVFTNAHNEILNQLCNVGILGTVSYLAIFVTGVRRYRNTRVSGPGLYGYCEIWGGYLGLLAIAMYGAHALISFQQVLNAPLFFLALGLCEYGMRSRKREGGKMEDYDEVDEI